MSNPLVTINLAVLNGEKYIRHCLDAILAQSYPYEMMEFNILDNGSTDNTPAVVQSIMAAFPDRRIRLISEMTPGLLAGRHRGYKETTAPVLVYVDDDIRADPGWLAAIHSAFHDPDVHLVGGRNLPEYEVQPPSWLKSLQCAGPEVGWFCPRRF